MATKEVLTKMMINPTQNYLRFISIHYLISQEQLLTMCVQILQIQPSNRSLFQQKCVSALLASISFFQKIIEESTDIKKRLEESLQYQYLKPNQILFNQGELGTRFFFILKGTVKISIKVPDAKTNQMNLMEINELSSGASFGEIALQNQGLRTATICAKTECHLAYLEKQDYQKIIKDESEKKTTDMKVNFLTNYNFFRNWSLRELRTLSFNFHLKEYSYGQIIFSQSDFANQIYFVMKGYVGLEKIIKKQIKQICLIDKFQIFGEDCFIDKEGNINFDFQKNLNTTTQKKQVQEIKKTTSSTSSFNGIEEPIQDQFVKSPNMDDQQKRIYQAISRSQNTMVAYINKNDLNNRFYDPITRSRFYEDYLKKIVKFRQQQLNLKFEPEIDLQDQEFVKIQNLVHKHDITSYESNEFNNSVVSPQEKQKRKEIFMKLLDNELSSGKLYQILQKDNIEAFTRYSKKLEVEFINHKIEEKTAMLELRKVLYQMDFSYQKVKNYFQQKKLGTDKLFFYAYLKQEVKRRMKNQNSKQREERKLRVKSEIHCDSTFESIVINNQIAESKQLASFENLLEEDKSPLILSKLNQQMISYSSQNKYRKRVKTEINEENLNIDYRKIITSFCGTPQNNQKTQTTQNTSRTKQNEIYLLHLNKSFNNSPNRQSYPKKIIILNTPFVSIKKRPGTMEISRYKYQN